MKKSLLKFVITSGALISSAMVIENMIENKERKSFESYGTRISTPYGQMNVSIEGNKGPVIVLLSGYGTAAPILDFKPLAQKMSAFAQVVTIEYLGYGNSDVTLRPRTVSNICEEVHALMKELQYDQYYLMGHSISGVYDLYYQHTYPNEVLGVIGIDPSIPEQIDYVDASIEEKIMTPLRKIGLLRLLDKIKPNTLSPSNNDYDEKTLSKIKAMTLSSKSNESLKDENKRIKENFNTCRNIHYPQELPVLIFISSNNCKQVKWWEKLHQQQLENCPKAKLIKLEGNHYLHWTNSQKIADEVQHFIEENQYEI
ncbi:MAG: alpha/beta fold hydrolase [Traorella sp.]